MLKFRYHLGDKKACERVLVYIIFFCCLSRVLPTLEKDSFLLTTSFIFLREELVRLSSNNSSGSLVMELCSNDLEGSLFV